MHVKDTLVPLPVRGRPDEYRLRFGGVGYVGTREECSAVATAIEGAAAKLSGETAVEAARREDYEKCWAPLLARKVLPRYVNVPEWARAMYDAMEVAA